MPVMDYAQVRLPDNGYMVTTLPVDQATAICKSIAAGEANYSRVFKDTSKAFVGVLAEVGESDAVVKIPRSRSKRRWERFLTYFRHGESIRQFNRQLNLIELGVKGPTPLMAVEWRANGVVVDGFYLYEFIYGRGGSKTDRNLIARELLKLYSLGYTRKDPKPENFVVSGENVYLIDFTLDKPLFFSKIRRAMELSQFSGSFGRYKYRARSLGFSDIVICYGWALQGLSQRLRRVRRNASKFLGK